MTKMEDVCAVIVGFYRLDQLYFDAAFKRHQRRIPITDGGIAEEVFDSIFRPAKGTVNKVWS